MTVKEVGWEDSWLHDLYRSRRNQEMDLVGVISDAENRRGTGKTTAAIQLGDRFDWTDEGLTPSKAAIDPHELREAYTREAKGSALILDEAEVGVSKYDATTKISQALKDLISMGRVEQKYVIINAPASSHIDADVRELADFWMLVDRRGKARVYQLGQNPFAEGRGTYTEFKEFFRWPDIDDPQLQEVYDALDEEKKRRLDGEEGTNWILESEAEERVEKAREDAVMEFRDQLIANLVEVGVDPVTVSDALPPDVRVGRSRISQISNETDVDL